MVFTKSKNITSPLTKQKEQAVKTPGEPVGRKGKKKDFSKYTLCIKNIIRDELGKKNTNSKSIKLKEESIHMLNDITTATIVELLRRAKAIMNPKMSTMAPNDILGAIKMMFPIELHAGVLSTISECLSTLQAFYENKKSANERGEKTTKKTSASNKAAIMFSIGRLVNPIRESSVKRFNSNIPYILGAAMDFLVRGMFNATFDAASIKRQNKIKKAEDLKENVKMTIDRMDIRNGLANSDFAFIFRYCILIGTGMHPRVLIATNKRVRKPVKKTPPKRSAVKRAPKKKVQHDEESGNE